MADMLGTPTVTVVDSDGASALSYHPGHVGSGVVRVEGQGVDITIPISLFDRFVEELAK